MLTGLEGASCIRMVGLSNLAKLLPLAEKDSDLA